MIVPGANLLAMATSIIGTETVELYRFATRVQNARGDWVNTYAAPGPAAGSWQPVEAAKYQALGLDLKKKYFWFYTQEPIQTIERSRGADLILRSGRRYEAEREVPWSDVDGWNGVMFVDVGPEL